MGKPETNEAPGATRSSPRSPSPDPRRSRTRGTSGGPSRSRSPLREDREKTLLRAENKALKAEIKKLTATVEAQQGRIDSLERQIQAQHLESMSKLGDITALLTEQRRGPAEKMETDAVAPGAAVAVAAEKPRTQAGKPPAPARAPGRSPARSSRECASVSASECNPGTSRSPEKATRGPRSAPATTPATAPGEDSTTKAEKIPPIVLRRKEDWNGVSKSLITRKIAYTKARLIGDGIQILPASVEDHRKLTRFLTEEKKEYHTYSLPENRLLRVVIRGIPEGIPLDEVKEDLVEQGLAPVSVARMTSRRTKAAMPLLLVQLPETDEEKILAVNRCCGLVVRTERQRAAPAVSQCHRCQKFGHAQSKCSAKPKCVKCAGDHHSGDCKKPATSPAKCCNCAGEHPASYRGCPSYPKKKGTAAAPSPPKAKAPAGPPPARPSQKPAAAPRAPARSFADAAKRGTQAPPRATAPPAARPAANAADLTAVLAQMQQMCAAMSAFFAQMPSLAIA